MRSVEPERVLSTVRTPRRWPVMRSVVLGGIARSRYKTFAPVAVPCPAPHSSAPNNGRPWRRDGTPRSSRRQGPPVATQARAAQWKTRWSTPPPRPSAGTHAQSYRRRRPEGALPAAPKARYQPRRRRVTSRAEGALPTSPWPTVPIPWAPAYRITWKRSSGARHGLRFAQVSLRDAFSGLR